MGYIKWIYNNGIYPNWKMMINWFWQYFFIQTKNILIIMINHGIELCQLCFNRFFPTSSDKASWNITHGRLWEIISSWAVPIIFRYPKAMGVYIIIIVRLLFTIGFTIDISFGFSQHFQTNPLDMARNPCIIPCIIPSCSKSGLLMIKPMLHRYKPIYIYIYTHTLYTHIWR